MDGTPLTTISNSCAFCTLILSTEAGRQRCINAWREAAAAPQDTPPQMTMCHAGLYYVWGRIEIRGKSVAATHAGQLLDRPPEGGGWSRRIAELSAATGLEAGRLRDALASVPDLDRDKQELVPRLLRRVAETFSEMGEERLNLLGRLQRIAEMSQY
jgi:ligand-binding sensor protein